MDAKSVMKDIISLESHASSVMIIAANVNLAVHNVSQDMVLKAILTKPVYHVMIGVRSVLRDLTNVKDVNLLMVSN